MKKTILGIIALLVVACLCGCQYSNNPYSKDTSTAIDYENEEDLVFKTFALANNLEAVTGFSTEDTIDWGSSTFNQIWIGRIKSIKVSGKRYGLYYSESAKLPMTAETVHTYSINGSEKAKVIFDEKNERVVEYVNVPQKISYESEQEYIDFISKLVDDGVDLSKYEYKCTTWYYVYSDKGMESVVDDGFRKCGENEKLVAYSFYFDKYVDGMKTLDHVSAEFFIDSFSMEINDLGYTDEMFSRLNSEARNDINKNIVEYLNSHLLFDSKLDDCRVVDQVLFIRDGKPYCQTIVDVDVSNDDFGVITSRQQLITGWFSSESKQ